MSIPKLNGYEVSGAAAKNCFIVLCHGGGLDGYDHNGKPTGWMNHEDWDISDEVRIKVSRKGHLALVMAFKNECTRVCGYRRAMNHENLVKRCASSQNLQAGAALASIRRRCEKHDPVGRHREVVRLLRMTDELLLVFGVDRLSATRIAFVRCFLGHLLFLQVREKSARFSQSTGMWAAQSPAREISAALRWVAIL